MKILSRRVESHQFTYDEVNDIIGDTVFRACRSFDSYDPSKAKISTWVGRIALNCVRDAATCKKNRQAISEPLTAVDKITGRERNTYEFCDKEKGFSFEKTELFSEYETDRDIDYLEFEYSVEMEISKLSDRDQRVARMLIDGYSNSDIAKVDGGSINAVTKRVCVVRKTLKGPLSQLAARFDINFAKLAS